MVAEFGCPLKSRVQPCSSRWRPKTMVNWGVDVHNGVLVFHRVQAAVVCCRFPMLPRSLIVKYVVSTIVYCCEMRYSRRRCWPCQSWRRDVADKNVDGEREGIKDGFAASAEQRRRLLPMGDVGAGGRVVASAGDSRGCRSGAPCGDNADHNRGPRCRDGRRARSGMGLAAEMGLAAVSQPVEAAVVARSGSVEAAVVAQSGAMDAAVGVLRAMTQGSQLSGVG